MKKIFSLFVLTVYLWCSLNVAAQLFVFTVLRPYIAKTLCEKKEIVGNSCQGKCHLKKQIKQQVENEKEFKIASIKLPEQWLSHQIALPFFSEAFEFLILNSLEPLNFFQEPPVPPPRTPC